MSASVRQIVQFVSVFFLSSNKEIQTVEIFRVSLLREKNQKFQKNSL